MGYVQLVPILSVKVNKGGEVFLGEFQDFFTTPRIMQYTEEQVQWLRNHLWRPASGCDAERYYAEAVNYIKTHPQHYFS